MRILILHSRYLSGAASGENRVLEDETRLLTQAGHEVSVLAPTPSETGGALDLVRTAVGAVWSASAAKEVTSTIRAGKPDVVHCHNLFPALSPTVLRAAAASGRPVVMTLHNYRLACLPATLLRDGRICQDCVGRVPWPGVLHRCYRGSRAASAVLATSITLHRKVHSFDKVSAFFAISRFVRDKHIEAGLPGDRIIIKPNFAWPTEQRVGAGEYFLYLGRLTPEKGVSTLIRAWRDAPAPLLVVGEGPEEEALRRLAPSSVEFHSTVSPESVPTLLRGARALLVPSLWYEGFGKVVVEAYASGVGVLASHIGALPEVVEHGVSGLLLPPDDVEAWQRAAWQLMDDEVSIRLGKAGFATWESRYHPEIGMRDLERAYETAIDLHSKT